METMYTTPCGQLAHSFPGYFVIYLNLYTSNTALDIIRTL